MAKEGNPNPTGRKADKIIRDALLGASRQDPERIKRVANRVWDMAEEGDMEAFKEIANRIDGKVPQAVIGGDETDSPISHSLTVKFIHGNTNT